jgi:hypothetical protein
VYQAERNIQLEWHIVLNQQLLIPHNMILKDPGEPEYGEEIYALFQGCGSGLTSIRIRIWHFNSIRIRIQINKVIQSRSNTDPQVYFFFILLALDPDPDPGSGIRIQNSLNPDPQLRNNQYFLPHNYL